MGRINYKDIAVDIAAAIEEKKGTDTVIFDVGGMTSFTEYFVLCTVNSEAQMRAVLKEITREIKVKPDHIEGKTASGWVLLDFGSVVVNIFTPEAREFYRLERLWGEAEKVSYKTCTK